MNNNKRHTTVIIDSSKNTKISPQPTKIIRNNIFFFLSLKMNRPASSVYHRGTTHRLRERDPEWKTRRWAELFLYAGNGGVGVDNEWGFNVRRCFVVSCEKKSSFFIVYKNFIKFYNFFFISYCNMIKPLGVFLYCFFVLCGVIRENVSNGR